ncbi:hypothetical protein C1J03_18995 [Sulfitobacter sp. SK012]|uniref:AraC family transcriptional regulator n=1 Tax=Sulfitobacter sp. SK012 TaxID=1389005 RepID=UPI000E0A98E6|nr:AraC family transcriptional regulator [Sulfitobacter sp. SK012]AXI47907.1 hypothetical protein C1J03_18995 [Sulfitobacter sp. SK012]
MISAMSLGAMPQFAVEQLGEKKTRSALHAVGLPKRFIDARDGYISEHALSNFIGLVSRSIGYDRLGLLWAPFITVADYGAWGRYVLGAPDLGTALLRAQKEMQLHSNTDRVGMRVGTREVIYSYVFGLRGHPSYPDVAYTAIASILSIPRHFLGDKWVPLRIEFDFPKPVKEFQVEETFHCPVTFGHKDLRIYFPRNVLGVSNPDNLSLAITSRQDILRERAAGPPTTLVQSTQALVLQQLSEQIISLDRTAMSLGTSVRTLQRQLNEEGVTFRTLVNDVRMQRAQELLSLKGSTVRKVATTLGYTSPNNFSRAFSTNLGISPRQAQKISRSGFILT